MRSSATNTPPPPSSWHHIVAILLEISFRAHHKIPPCRPLSLLRILFTPASGDESVRYEGEEEMGGEGRDGTVRKEMVGTLFRREKGNGMLRLVSQE